MEKSKRSEATLTVRMNHEDDRLKLEPNSVRKSEQGKQSRDDDTNNKEERLQKQTS